MARTDASRSQPTQAWRREPPIIAKAKAASLREAAANRIADTIGGKIAAAIKAQGSGTTATPSFGDNTVRPANSSETEADPESEIDAFTNREHGVHGSGGATA